MARKKLEATTGPSSAPVLRALKQEVDRKVADLIEEVLKPRHVKPPQPGRQSRLVGIATKWLGPRCYFVALYRSVDPPPTDPDFGSNFARMEHVGGGKFTLSYMRDNGRWADLSGALSVDERLKAVRDAPRFVP
jgi:hypothetical protein